MDSSRQTSRPSLLHSSRYTRNNFIKALGLEIIFLLRSGRSELPKPVYNSSLKTAIARSAIHWIPVSVSVVLITINLSHLFLGRQYTGVIIAQPFNAFLLQVAAKLHEMTIIASLTAVILHVIRRELLHGPGVPLGAIGGGFLFSSLNYLWSPGLWGAFRSRTSKLSKIRLYSIIILCTLLAAAVGPSAAVLMIPREQEWEAGGAKIWFSGDQEDVYSTYLPDHNSIQLQLCSRLNATQYPFCPSGGYSTILQEALKDAFVVTNANKLSKVQRVLQDHTPVDLRLSNGFKVGGNVDIDSLIMKWTFRGVDCQTGAVAGRMSEAIRARMLALDFGAAAWNFPFTPSRPSLSQYKYRETIVTSCTAQIPMVKTACSAAVVSSEFNTKVLFPVLKPDACWVDEQAVNISLPNQEPSTRFRTSWVQLPTTFGPSSIGMVLESPWDMTSNSRLLIGCNIGAGWSSGLVSNPEDVWMYRGIPSFGSPWVRGYVGETYVPDPSWRTIQFGKQWLDILAPVADDKTNATTLEIMIENSGISQGLFNPISAQEIAWNESPDTRNRSVIVEAVLAVVFADALSREGSLEALDVDLSRHWHDWRIQNADHNDDLANRIFANNEPYKRPEQNSLTLQEAKVTILGLAYMASAQSDYLAIAVLCVHILLALLHIWFLIQSRESSGSWHTLTELIALAHNSQPSRTALNNTGAGIKELETYSKVAVVRATKPGHNVLNPLYNGLPHFRALSLVFREGDTDEVEKEGLLGNASSMSTVPRSRAHSPVAESHLSGDVQNGTEVRFDEYYK
ncbi:MAG: hypothetical protein GOMPHAMPRED_006176 [Gomphillus americanus]|uniref:Uncharacterized protein n=1 Tax=Gomphillus americanus TaxID=1940652 RepID=A0A8H3I836_9LECA|nr:MAG: hypothetical protein GOMPHAMPRED_006176 [Gomphillus americanus]